MPAVLLFAAVLLLPSSSLRAEEAPAASTATAVAASTTAPSAVQGRSGERERRRFDEKDNIPSPGQLDNLFDGEKPGAPASAGEAPRAPRLGLGVDVGQGLNLQDDYGEPYNTKGFERLPDVSVRARVEADGLGATARWRDVRKGRRFVLTFKSYLDVPGLLQLGDARDKLYGVLGQPPPDRPSGFDVAASGNVSPHLGLTAEYDGHKLERSAGWSSDQVLSTGVGYSPKGNNPGRPWNYTYVLFVDHEKVDVELPGVSEHREGFGWAAGLAYQHALKDLPIPVLNSPGAKGVFWLDRFKASLLLGDSDVWSFSVNLSAGASLYVTKAVELFLGGTLKVVPQPKYYTEQKVSVSPNLGLSLHGW